MSFRRRQFLQAATATIAAASLNGTLAPMAFAQAEQAVQPVHVKFGWQRGIQIPYQATRILGLGDRYNMTVDWTRFDAGPAMLPALQSGSVDMAQMGASPALVGVANGLDISIIGICQNIAGGEGLVARKGANIKSIPDLVGKRIGVVVGSSAHGGLIAALEQHDLKISDVSVINIGPSQMLPAFENEDLDAVYIWDPYMSYAMRLGGELIQTSAEVGDLGAYTASHGFWVVRKDFLKENTEAVRRFMHVADLGMRLYENGGDEKARIISTLAAELNLEADIVQEMIDRVVFPTPAQQLDVADNYAFAPVGSSPMRIVESLIALSELQVQFGNLKEPVTADEITPHVDASMLHTLNETPALPLQGATDDND